MDDSNSHPKNNESIPNPKRLKADDQIDENRICSWRPINDQTLPLSIAQVIRDYHGIQTYTANEDTLPLMISDFKVKYSSFPDYFLGNEISQGSVKVFKESL